MIHPNDLWLSVSREYGSGWTLHHRQVKYGGNKKVSWLQRKLFLPYRYMYWKLTR